MAALAAVLFAVIAVSAGCSSNSGNGLGGDPGTALGAYTVTVTATSAGATAQQTTIILNVQ
jgi:hypothetical protein